MPLVVGLKPETGEVISADTRCNPVPERLGRFGVGRSLCGGVDIKLTFPRLFHTHFDVYPVEPRSLKKLPFGHAIKAIRDKVQVKVEEKNHAR